MPGNANYLCLECGQAFVKHHAYPEGVPVGAREGRFAVDVSPIEDAFGFKGLYCPGQDAEHTARRLIEGTKGFAAEMREKGIHVGLGSSPVCVTCGQDWPCSQGAPE